MRYLLLLVLVSGLGCQAPEIRRVSLTVRHPSVEGEYRIESEFFSRE
jgi:hypothetical protein